MSHAGLLALALMGAGFCLLRTRHGAFSALCAALIAGVLILTLRSPAEARVEGAILLAGLALSAFGLLGVRAMLRRSVSLKLLAAAAPGGAPVDARQLIATRVDDLSSYRLARPTDGVYRLTRPGRLVGALVCLCTGRPRGRG